MERIRFTLVGGLSADHLGLVHEAVLRILSGIGLACEHPQTVEAVRAGGGVRYEGGRLKFSSDLVNATIEQMRRAGRQLPTGGELRVTGPWTCYNVIDMRSGEVRGSTAADAVEMLKLVASYYQSGTPPVFPCELDSRLQVLWLEKTCCELAPGFGGGVVALDPETIRWIGELRAAAGKPYHLHLQFVISPLRLDRIALDLFWRFRDNPQVKPGPSASPIPVAGLSAPAFAPGLLAQGVAEQLGGIIVAQRLCLAGSETVLGLAELDYGDMRYLTTAHSLPETLMVALLQQDIVEYFSGYRPTGMFLCTNAKRADSFAAADRMAYLLLLGLAGFRDFSFGAGQLSMDEIFSPAQFIIDREICRYVGHILAGAQWQGDSDTIVRAVAEGVANGNFLSHESTLASCREWFDSAVFRRDNADQWRAAGGKSVEQAALEEAAAAIESFVPPASATYGRDLGSVFTEACRALGIDLRSQPLPHL
jgi:trimethylamine:corrinoid methyltransferase-like protein